MKTKVWVATVAFGCLAALSSGVSADLIPAVDAWGRGTSATEQNQEAYNNGAYGSAHIAQVIDGDKTAHAYPDSARVGGNGALANLWMYVDLGADYVIDRVDLWGNAMGMYGLNGYFVVATAPDGTPGTGDQGTLWSENNYSWTTEENTVGAPFTLQVQGNANADAVWGNSDWAAAQADALGESVSVSIPIDSVTARYVQVGGPATGYGGFSLAEIEVYGTIPEPASAAVIGLGGILLMIRRRRS